jgi:hypothetical protein
MRILNPAPTQTLSYDTKLLQTETRILVRIYIYILEEGTVCAWHRLVRCTNETELQPLQAATRVSDVEATSC